MTRKPRHQFLPLTYIPKITAVCEGTCTQSIRVGKDGKYPDLIIGDFVAFHGWSGKPYHSPWSFRTPYCELILAEPINIHEDSIYFLGEKKSLNFDDPQLDLLALKDGIEPPTGRELIDGLHALYGPGVLHGKVLRWDPFPLPIPDERAKGNNSDPEICKRCLEEFQRVGCSCSEFPNRCPKQSVSPSAATIDDLFEDPTPEECFVIKPDPSQVFPDGRIKMEQGDFDNLPPEVNQPLFQKLRIIERDLRSCSQEVDS